MERRHLPAIALHPDVRDTGARLATQRLNQGRDVRVRGIRLARDHRSRAVLVTDEQGEHRRFLVQRQPRTLFVQVDQRHRGPGQRLMSGEPSDRVSLGVEGRQQFGLRRSLQHRSNFPGQVVRALNGSVGSPALNGGMVCPESPTRKTRPHWNWSATCSYGCQAVASMISISICSPMALVSTSPQYSFVNCAAVSPLSGKYVVMNMPRSSLATRKMPSASGLLTCTPSPSLRCGTKLRHGARK